MRPGQEKRCEVDYTVNDIQTFEGIRCGCPKPFCFTEKRPIASVAQMSVVGVMRVLSRASNEEQIPHRHEQGGSFERNRFGACATAAPRMFCCCDALPSQRRN